MNNKQNLWTWAFSIAFFQLLFANEPLVPLPSILDFSPNGGWGGALGFSLEYESAYDGSDEKEVEIDPFIALHYRKDNHLFFWEGIELGLRSKWGKQSLTQVMIRREGGREADDSEDGHLNGLNERDDVFVGVLEYRYALSPAWKTWLGARWMGGGSDFGHLGILALGYRFGDRKDGLGSEILTYSTFGDADFFYRDFGINENESVSSGYPVTELGSGYRSTAIEWIDRRQLYKKIQWLNKAGMEFYSSKVQESPIARKNQEFEISTSLYYVF